MTGDPVHQNGAQQNDGNAHEIHQGSHPGCILEERAGKEGDNRQLGAAGHEGSQHSRRPALPLVANGTAGHDAGDGTAGAHHKGNDRLAGKTHLLEDRIQNDRCTGHIAAVFQQGDEEIHHHDQRQEAHNSRNTANDAVNQQSL